jgi:hypothetical protein
MRAMRKLLYVNNGELWHYASSIPASAGYNCKLVYIDYDSCHGRAQRSYRHGSDEDRQR